MDTKLIKEIISIVENSLISELEIEESGCRIRVGKSLTRRVEPENITLSEEKDCLIPIAPSTKDSEPEKMGENVISPMLGIYYSSPSPQKEPFIKIGDKVKKGDVLCIIEAMKIMNEITADKDGEITQICAINGQIIEYGQTILKMV